MALDIDGVFDPAAFHHSHTPSGAETAENRPQPDGRQRRHEQHDDGAHECVGSDAGEALRPLSPRARRIFQAGGRCARPRRANCVSVADFLHRSHAHGRARHGTDLLVRRFDGHQRQDHHRHAGRDGLLGGSHLRAAHSPHQRKSGFDDGFRVF